MVVDCKIGDGGRDRLGGEHGRAETAAVVADIAGLVRGPGLEHIGAIGKRLRGEGPHAIGRDLGLTQAGRPVENFNPIDPAGIRGQARYEQGLVPGALARCNARLGPLVGKDSRYGRSARCCCIDAQNQGSSRCAHDAGAAAHRHRPAVVALGQTPGNGEAGRRALYRGCKIGQNTVAEHAHRLTASQRGRECPAEGERIGKIRQDGRGRSASGHADRGGGGVRVNRQQERRTSR